MLPDSHLQPILLFDGICNYCNAWVDFIIRHDKKKQFHFAALQSIEGKKIISRHNISSEEDSAILIEGEKIYYKSSVGLRIMKHVGGVYYPLYFFIMIPSFIRNFFYDIIARNRYKWWGKRNDCMISSDEMRK